MTPYRLKNAFIQPKEAFMSCTLDSDVIVVVWKTSLRHITLQDCCFTIVLIKTSPISTETRFWIDSYHGELFIQHKDQFQGCIFEDFFWKIYLPQCCSIVKFQVLENIIIFVNSSFQFSPQCGSCKNSSLFTLKKVSD